MFLSRLCTEITSSVVIFIRCVSPGGPEERTVGSRGCKQNLQKGAEPVISVHEAL